MGFALNALELLVVMLWLVGLAAAVFSFARGRRGLRGATLVVVAAAVPVLGSALAIGSALAMGATLTGHTSAADHQRGAQVG